MPGLAFTGFLGEMPIRDMRLLPDGMAKIAENVRTDGGSLKTVNENALITALSGATRKVFRIPTGALDTFAQSHWMQFSDENTDIARTPNVNDSFERYYWCSPSEGPRYNTKARIIAGDPSYKLGVPAPTTAPSIFVDPETGERLPPTGDFDHDAYLALYPDIAAALEADSYRTAYEHYVSVGRPAGRPYPFEADTEEYDGEGVMVPESGVFDADAYYALYEDAREYNAARIRDGAFDDWYKYGRFEGREYPIVDGTEIEGDLKNPVVTRSYVYTFVTIYGEEGPPSPPTEAVGAIDQEWTITTVPHPSFSGRAPIDKIRVYRTVTAASGRTTFFRVTDLAVGATTFVDVQTDTIITGNLQLASLSWEPPDENLQGIVAMPNGILAGWYGNTVYFSENYRPHAWPSEYQVAVQHPIVGLGVFGSSLVVCTSGQPAVISGVRASAMAMQDNIAPLPCHSRRSIVSTNDGVIFASENGLVMLGPGGVRLLTDDLIGRYEWQRVYKPFSLKACLAGGSYCGVYTDGGVTRAFLLDPRDPRRGIVHLTGFAFGAAVQTDPWSGKPFVVQSSQLSELLPATGTRRYGLWRSKEMQAPRPLNFAAGEVFYDPYDGPGLAPGEQVGELKVWADGRVVYDQPFFTSDKTFRLPSGFKAEIWQVEIRTRVRVHAVHLAESASELQRV